MTTRRASTEQSRNPLKRLVSLLGVWGLLLLVLAVAAVGTGLAWERWRHPPVPAAAQQVNTALSVDVRQTSYRHPGPVAVIDEFYRQALPARGWSYCGTQATPGCTNLPRLVDRPDDALLIYRRADAQEAQGATIEIWPIVTEDGQLFVTVYETRGQ